MNRFFQRLGIVLVLFSLGWLSAQIVDTLQSSPAEKPFSMSQLLFGSLERQSPGNHVAENNILLYQDKVVILLPNTRLASYEDTNSMDPMLDTNSNGLEVRPDMPSQLQPGDVISFRTLLTDGLVVHRIVEIGEDMQGWYARTKGDNNQAADPEKVRFEDVHGVLIGVVY